MSPTVLLADPSVRLAGVRPRRRYVRVARRRTRVRWTRLLLGALLLAAALGLAFLQTWPPLATVMSGSMAPTIDTGDVVVLKRLERPARAGDIVSIPVPEEARARFGYPPVVIHRIVAIDATGAVTTKGDARKEPDPFSVPSTALTTRVVASVPAAGRALAFLGSPLGLLWLVGGAGMLLGLPLLERYRDAQRRVQGERDGLQAALEAVTAELAALRADETGREADAADREARLAAEAAAGPATAEAHQQALAEAAVAQAHLRDVTAAFARHLEELPALIERAIADAFASAAPAPPPPPVPEPVPALVPAAPKQPTPDLFAGFVPASTAKPIPDLLGVLQLKAAWDSPPPDLAMRRRFAPPVNTFFA